MFLDGATDQNLLDSSRFAVCLVKLVLTLLSLMSAEPSMVEPGRKIKTVKPKRRGDPPREYWTPNIVGRLYRPTIRTDGQGTGSSTRRIFALAETNAKTAKETGLFQSSQTINKLANLDYNRFTAPKPAVPKAVQGEPAGLIRCDQAVKILQQVGEQLLRLALWRRPVAVPGSGAAVSGRQFRMFRPK